MPSTATTRNRLEKQAAGENENTWGDRFNANFADLIDKSLDGMVSFALSGSKTLTDEDFADDEARQRYLNITGGSGGTVTIPNLEKWYLVRNAASAAVTFTTGSGTTATVGTGGFGLIVCEGGNVVRNATALIGGDGQFTGNMVVGRDAANLTLTLQSQNPILVIKDTNTAGSSAVGEIRFTDSADANRFRIISGNLTGTTTLTGGSVLQFAVGTVEFVNIGTTASAANAFLNSGSNNSLLRSTSSLRYKQDVNDLGDDAADILLQLRPITYRSKADADDPETVHWGLIAEEVAEVLPHLVHFDGDGKPDGVQYERAIVGLLSLVKRLDARVSALESA